MSSDEDLFLVEEILNQRKRKKGLEYLVRWKGYSELYDSWEPAAAIAHCSLLIQNFLNKKKSAGSKSRSRSRGRFGSKSRSRSGSRGRAPKSRSARIRSRSRSASRTDAQPAASTSISVKEEVAVADLKPPSVRSRPQRERGSEQRSSAEKGDVVREEASTWREPLEGATSNRKTEMLTRTVETVRSMPPRTQPARAVPGSRQPARAVPGSSLAVRQVQNDQKPASTGSTSTGESEEMWFWWFVDYATVTVFVLVSLCVLSYSIDSSSSVLPSGSVLRQRLGESYDLLVQELSYAFSALATTARAVYQGSDKYTDGYRGVLNWLSSSHREGQNQTGGQPLESGKV